MAAVTYVPFSTIDSYASLSLAPFASTSSFSHAKFFRDIPICAMEPSPSFKPVSDLPVEILCLILQELSDVETLRAAILNSPPFYRAFIEAESSITASVIVRQICSTEISEAFIAYESAVYTPPCDANNEPGDRRVSKLCDEFQSKRPEAPKNWTLRKALRFGKLHFHVDWMTRSFCILALEKDPIRQVNHCATDRELSRIRRIFYRFEMYRNIYRLVEGHKIEDSGFMKPFFKHFSPWESEQLGCVHDFLHSLIAPGRSLVKGVSIDTDAV